MRDDRTAPFAFSAQQDSRDSQTSISDPDDHEKQTLKRSDHMVPAGIAKDQTLIRRGKPSYLCDHSNLIAQARQEQSLGVSFDTPSASGQRY